MRVNYQTNSAVQFQILTDDQRQEIFRSALQVMEHTGIEVHNEEALSVLKAQGAAVEGTRARIPGYLVQRALSTAPSMFTVYSREGNTAKNITIGPNHINYGPGPTCPNFRDARTNERRKYLRRDATDVARVCDALPNIDFVESLGTINDVNIDLADVYEFADMIANTGKPIVAWSYTLETCRDIHQIAAAVAGGEDKLRQKPNYIFYAEPLSPLVSSREAADKLLYCSKHRIPIIYTPCPMCGGTAPTTSAGILVTAMCESLHGLVISQAISPGTPFVMGGVVSIMDMLSSVLAYGAPELALQSAAITEMARYVGLPVWSTAGCTDSKLVDEQAGIESALSILLAGLSGANLAHDVGFIESALTGSLQMATMSDEIIGYVKRILRGIEVTPETLATQVIQEVGPGGHYLGTDHTLGHFKTQFYFPQLMDRSRWEEWEAMGHPSMGDRVQMRVNDILDTHEPALLAPEVKKQIEDILAKAEARYRD
ncbi:MAG: trimethylamine methyltransferase [Chloroflexi bacterium]|nr:trimethylamine methyltransferase [Chloroflexota bacterium]